ncbi:DUF4952 domain-containing protein [Achromobacter deleyi]|uniref:DUF4952 domain-containing protein n=1 Tax=Achromobacter deleyi TaxID=1353891 RepID=UPI00149319B5|nr:DUF4952 domain-containing protein [Achromobacter deleyi]QVQ28917.1 DUF4952 domain-containing protein [Achromobacter deleyi]UIP19032.1 DUF4952 domain-containing protein [Achromobacter deleyi]
MQYYLKPGRSPVVARLALLLTAAALGCAPVPGYAQAQEIQARDAAEARAQGVAPPGMPCQDFLQALGRKPDGVEYLGCERHDDLQARPMIARYRVAGAAAARAEADLGLAFGMPPLEFACCGWGTKPHWWRDERTGLQYGLGMGTETPSYPRADWGRIPGFDITVALYTEII